MYDQRTIANLAPSHKIADPNSDEIASSKFTVDRHIEQRTIAQSLFPFEPESDHPDFLLLQRPLGSNVATGIPGGTVLTRRIKR